MTTSEVARTIADLTTDRDADLVKLVADKIQFGGEFFANRAAWESRAAAAVAVAKPMIERALLERLVRDGTQLADECLIQRDTGIAGAIVLELNEARRKHRAGGE